MNDTLYEADWMDDTTKAIALDKLEHMNDTITKEDVNYLYDQAQLVQYEVPRWTLRVECVLISGRSPQHNVASKCDRLAPRAHTS